MTIVQLQTERTAVDFCAQWPEDDVIPDPQVYVSYFLYNIIKFLTFKQLPGMKNSLKC